MTTTQTGVAAIWQARAKPGKGAEVRSAITRSAALSCRDAGDLDYDAHVLGDVLDGVVSMTCVVARYIDGALQTSHGLQGPSPRLRR